MCSYLASTDLVDRDTIVREYFRLGFHYKEIRSLLSSGHGVDISLSHLKRELKPLHLKRRNRTPQEEILDAVQSELNAGSNTIGYRAMYQRLQQNGVCATRDKNETRLRSLLRA